MASGEWVVQIDDDGRVVVDPTRPAAASYLVLANADGTLDLLERDRVRAAAPEAPAPAAPADDEVAEAELARWAAVAGESERQLADQRLRQRSDAGSRQAGPVIDLSPTEAPQPAALTSSAREANSPTLADVDNALRYWLIQNRDARVLFQQRSSSRMAAPGADAMV